MSGLSGVFRVIDNPDGTMSFQELTPEEIKADRELGERERAALIKAKGHDCWADENIAAHFDPDLQLGDYYTCRICGDLLQVG